MNEAEGGKFEKAARAGDLKVIQQLLSKIDVKQPADKNWLDRSLAQAVFGRSIEAVELLLKAGGNPNQDTSVGTLLSYPACNGDLHIVKKLIEGGANCNREFKRETALSAALEHSQTSVIEYLEKLGAHSPPDTTLFFACANGDIKLAKKALDSGANVEKTGGTFGETPLMVASRKGQVEAVKLLLKHKANLAGHYADKWREAFPRSRRPNLPASAPCR
jgi:ankyrin repeat protein